MFRQREFPFSGTRLSLLWNIYKLCMAGLGINEWRLYVAFQGERQTVVQKNLPNERALGTRLTLANILWARELQPEAGNCRGRSGVTTERILMYFKVNLCSLYPSFLLSSFPGLLWWHVETHGLAWHAMDFLRLFLSKEGHAISWHWQQQYICVYGLEEVVKRQWRDKKTLWAWQCHGTLTRIAPTCATLSQKMAGPRLL